MPLTALENGLVAYHRADSLVQALPTVNKEQDLVVPFAPAILQAIHESATYRAVLGADFDEPQKYFFTSHRNAKGDYPFAVSDARHANRDLLISKTYRPSPSR